MAPNPTTPLRGATPAWDSNSLDSSQAVEIVKVATSYGVCLRSTSKAAGIERRNVAAVAELGLLRSDWLGGRDSNPDTMVQSHVSYRWTTSQYQPTRANGQETPIIANRKREPASASPTGTGMRPASQRDRLRCRCIVGSARTGAACSARPVASLLFLLPAMARHAALAAGLTRFFARPLVRRALLMRGLAALARNLALLASIHRCKSAVFFGHHCLLAGPCRASRSLRHGAPSRVKYSGCNRCATKVARNSQR